MTADDWLAALSAELRRRRIDPAGPVGEAAAHLRDGGQDPLEAFGPPAAYALAVVAGLRDATPRPRGPSGEPRLRATGITKRYGRRTVLNGVDLSVHAGEVVAMIGANGSGKSTMLRICAGLLSPDSGHVRLGGTVGYCPQNGGTSDFLTPDEHFVLVGAGRGVGRTEARARGRSMAAALDWADAPRAGQSRHLSGGTRQKLNLILGRLGDPDVLLLDEPYQGFDNGTYLDFWQQVWHWRDAGKAIVVVTHLLNELDRVDTVLDLTPGRAR
ncbi:ATP-binding cassette domain-containing protein [Actinoplanes sp. NPDC049668]|uniref:ATP-binding cassette domain-containing protein n=1 Tax=unclassified Actinoplanes TaxID=2626549 RepID=UPI0033AD67DE